MKRAWIAFVATLIVVLPIRMVAVLNDLNPQTGFYSDGGMLVGVASALLAAGILLTAVLSARGGIERKGIEPLKSVPAAAFGALAGVFVLVQSVVGLGAGFFGDAAFFYRIFSAVGILAGAVILATAYDLATGFRTIGGHPLIALIPSLWECLLIVVLFITYSAVVNLVEDVYHTFTVVFLLLFLFTQAKLLTGIESAKSGKMIYAAGLPAALLALVTGLPSCAQYFSAGETAGAIPVGLHLADILLAVYILAFLFALQREPLPAAVEGVAEERGPEGETPGDDASAPKLAQGDDLSACVAFLQKAHGDGRKFVRLSESPFYSEKDFNFQESTVK